MAGTTTNYGWTYPTSTDLVKDGATAIQTAIQGADTSLFSITGGKNVGSVHLNTTTFTASSSVNITNVFSATYDNYLVVLRTDVSTTSTVRIRMGVGGTPNSTASNYKWGGYLSAVGSASGSFTGTVSNSWDIGEATTQLTANVTILSPFIAKSTNYLSSAVGSDYYNWSFNGNMSVTTSYTDLNILCSAGTMTGTVRIYGLRNS